MSALRRQTYANDTQPLFQPFGTAGPTGTIGPTGTAGPTGSQGPTGPAPTAVQGIITSNKTISPLTGSPSFFSVDNGFLTEAGELYDIQARGQVTIDSGTPASDDIVVISLYVGGGPPGSTQDFYIYPGQTNSGFGPGPSGVYYFSYRVRLPCISSDSIRVSAYAIGGIGSTASYTGIVFQLDGNKAS